jgi:hypothetical protein
VAFITSKLAEQGSMRPSLYEYKVWIFEINSTNLNTIYSTTGNYLEGACGEILSWTDTSIYVECGGGDGPLANFATYRIGYGFGGLSNTGIIEKCAIFEDKTQCTNFCMNSSDCKIGYFCNLSDNSCVKSCTNNSQCTFDNCQAFGPVRGCKI